MSFSDSYSIPMIYHADPFTYEILDYEISQLEGQLVELQTALTFGDYDMDSGINFSTQDDIIELEACIVQKKVVRNTTIPIGRLDSVMLQEIFFLLSQGEKVRKRSIKTTVKLTWVCHNWRNLAHKTSELWNYIDTSKPTLLSMALSRTQKRPLYFVSETLVWDEDLVSRCLPHLPRIAQLVLCTGKHLLPWNTRLLHLLATPAPALVDVALERVNLPTNLFAGTSMALRHLSLVLCNFNWESLRFNGGLKTLSIIIPGSKASLADLLYKSGLLGPELEVLRLSHTLQLTFTSPDPFERRLELSNIREFQLHERGTPARSVAFLLDQISLPTHPINLVSISMKGFADQLDAARAFVSCHGHGNRDEDKTAWFEGNCLEMKFEEDLENEVEVSIRIGDGPESAGGRGTTLNFGLPYGIVGFIPILDLLPLPGITALGLMGKYETQVDDDNEMTTLINRLDTIGPIASVTVVAPFISSFMEAIQDQVDRLQEFNESTRHDDGMDSGEHVYDPELCRSIIHFPHLTTLIFDGGLEDEEADVPTNLDLEDIEVLHEWLRWRKVLGMGVRKFMIRCMLMRGEDIQAVRPLYEGVVDEYCETDLFSSSNMDA